MYQVNSKYKNVIYDPNTKHNLRLLVDGVPIEMKYCRNIKLIDETFDTDNFTLGSACYSQINLEIDKEAFLKLNSYKEFYFEEIIKLDNEEEQIIPIGFFYSHDNDIDTKNDYYIKFTLYDKMYDWDKDTIDFSNQVEEGNFTRLDLVNLICERYNIELATSNFLNNDKLINVYDNTLSIRSWLSFVSERAGGFAKFGRDNKLYIKSYGEVDIVEVDGRTIGEFENSDLKTITRVAYQNGAQNFSFGDDSGVTIWLSQDNLFSCDENEVLNIYNSLKGVQFQSIDIQMWGDASIDTGDVIKVNNLISFCAKEWEYGNGWYGRYKNILNEVTSSIQVNKITQEQKRRRIQSLIDEINQTISLIIEDVDGNKAQLSQIIQSISNILLSIQNSGGSNLIKNSVGFAGTTEWNLSYDNEETSKVDTISNVELLQNGTSGGAFQLNGVKISQEIIVSSKDTYTFNCKVQKRAGFTGYVKVYNKNDLSQIWERNFNQEKELSFDTITFENIKINGNSLIVEFYGIEGSNLTITDSMLNLGDLSSIWTQANGEILNTQVNINLNGILVKSLQFDETGQYTVINPLEFAGYTNKNGVSTRIFTVNGDTTEVENIYVKVMFKLPPIKMVRNLSAQNKGVAIVADWSGIK